MTAAAVSERLLPEPAPQPQAQWQSLPLQFTGSGSEYFRIWIVNLLLVIVTLSLYLPYAKARRLRYFHGNTLVGGHALGFHGQGSKMLRGYALVLVFAACYVLAGQFSPLAAGLAGLALVGLWPALWQASLRFRLANTSWRGLRMQFKGSVGDAYRTLLPSMLPAGAVLLLTGLRGNRQAASGAAPLIDGLWVDALIGACVLLLLGAAPWLTARLKRYQHGSYHFAGDTTTLAATTGDFYRLWGRGMGVALVPLLLLIGGTSVLIGSGSAPNSPQRVAESNAILAMVLVFYALLFFGVAPWFGARLQNLVWGRTASPRLRFASRLRARDLAWLTLKNLLLTLLTLGMYRPFAVVATLRLRLAAVSLQSLGPPDGWVASLHALPGDAAGDAAGDLLGVDLGL